MSGRVGYIEAYREWWVLESSQPIIIEVHPGDVALNISKSNRGKPR